MAVPNEEITTPVLYKLDSKGVVRVWRAWTTLNEDGTATENNESGIEGGKLSGLPIVVLTGKNIGKSNETTPLQQANLKIKSKFASKVKEGYVEDLSDFREKGVMAAQSWAASKHRMSKIALQQPKLDGIRCKLTKRRDGTVEMMSRSNTEFKPFLKDLPWVQLFDSRAVTDEELDGELYIHGVDLNDIASLVMSYKYNTEELLAFCKNTDNGLRIDLKVKDILDLVLTGEFQAEAEYEENGSGDLKKLPKFSPELNAIEIGKNKGWIFPGYSIDDISSIGTSDLEYWVFDMPEADVHAEERNNNLRDRWSDKDAIDSGIVPVIAEEFDTDDIEDINARHVADGFEGTMIRLPSGMYAFGNRTHALLKFKLFHDSEWVIKGHELDREGNPTLIFTSDAGFTFKCRPKGTRSWRNRLKSDIHTLVGEKATIRYQTLHTETLCPQFGVVYAIRNYE